MSELTDTIDLSFLLESKELEQVAFNFHQVSLLFRSLEIDIRSACEIKSPDGNSWWWQPEHLSDMRMFALLLDSCVKSYRIIAGQQLTIILSNEFELLLFDHHVGYECFVLRAADGSFIAV